MNSAVVESSRVVQTNFIGDPVILEHVRPSLLHPLYLLLHGHVLLYYLQLLPLPLLLLPDQSPLLVLKPQVLLLMSQLILSFSLPLEFLHALVMLLEPLLDLLL